MVIIITSNMLINFYDTTTVFIIVILTGPTVLNLISTPFKGKLHKNFKLITISIIGALSLVSSAIVSVALITLTGISDIWGLVAFYGLQNLINSTLFFVFSPTYPELSFNRDAARWFISFSFRTAMSKLLGTVETKGDDYLVGTIGGSSMLGIYTIAWKLNWAFKSLVISTLNMGIAPTFTNMSEKMQKKRGLEFLYRVQFYIAIPGYILAALSAPEIIPLIFGEQWYKAIPVFQVMSFSAIFIPTIGISKLYYYSQGQPKKVLKIQVPYLSTHIVSLVIFIPMYGAIGAAMAVNITQIVGLVLCFYSVKKTLQIDFFDTLGPPVIAGCASILAGFSARQLIIPVYQLGVESFLITGLAVGSGFLITLILIDRHTVYDDILIIRQSVQDTT